MKMTPEERKEAETLLKIYDTAPALNAQAKLIRKCIQNCLLIEDSGLEEAAFKEHSVPEPAGPNGETIPILAHGKECEVCAALMKYDEETV